MPARSLQPSPRTPSRTPRWRRWRPTLSRPTRPAAALLRLDVAPAAARSSSLLNVDSFTGHGDSIYTILATDRTVGTNAAFTASRTWTLPAANAVNPGQEIVVADYQGTVTGTNTLVVSRAGSDTINFRNYSRCKRRSFTALRWRIEMDISVICGGQRHYLDHRRDGRRYDHNERNNSRSKSGLAQYAYSQRFGHT
jgi:hypothetical protein